MYICMYISQSMLCYHTAEERSLSQKHLSDAQNFLAKQIHHVWWKLKFLASSCMRTIPLAAGRTTVYIFYTVAQKDQRAFRSNKYLEKLRFIVVSLANTSSCYVSHFISCFKRIPFLQFLHLASPSWLTCSAQSLDITRIGKVNDTARDAYTTLCYSSPWSESWTWVVERATVF